MERIVQVASGGSRSVGEGPEGSGNDIEGPDGSSRVREGLGVSRRFRNDTRSGRVQEGKRWKKWRERGRRYGERGKIWRG